MKSQSDTTGRWDYSSLSDFDTFAFLPGAVLPKELVGLKFDKFLS